MGCEQVKLLIAFRNQRLRKLVELAVAQEFGQKKTGSGHLGVICPRCGEMTVFSGTQKDTTGFKYFNQECRLIGHGLKIKGRPERTCESAERTGAGEATT